jgi:hypothetical protein
MNPNEAQALLLEAVSERDPASLLDHAADLTTWLARGGFIPPLARTLSQAARLYTNDLFVAELHALIEKHR